MPASVSYATITGTVKMLSKQYLINNVAGCRCVDYHCTVTMGCGWIGSHHGGARMTCGKCSRTGPFHPGMSDEGFDLFNRVIRSASALKSQAMPFRPSRPSRSEASEYEIGLILQQREYEKEKLRAELKEKQEQKLR